MTKLWNKPYPPKIYIKQDPPKKTSTEEDGFLYYIGRCLKKYAVFDGVASKAEFWWFYLFCFLVGVIAFFIDLTLFDKPDGNGPAALIVSLGLLIPTFAVGSRRLHDVSRSGWWQLLIITGIGIFVLIIWWASESENSLPNKKIITPSNNKSSELADKLRELKELHKEGILTDQEFSKAKSKLLK